MRPDCVFNLAGSDPFFGCFLRGTPGGVPCVLLADSVVDADEDPNLAAQLADSEYKAKVERLLTLTIQAYDWNCPQHITPRYTEEEICEDLSRFCPDKIESCEHCE